MVCGVIQFRGGNAMAAWGAVFATAWMGCGEAPVAAAEAQGPIVCVEYVGKWSDKPILPLVITSAKPSRERLKMLLGDSSKPDHAEVFLFSEAEVRGLADQVARQLERLAAAATSGIVRITVAGVALTGQAPGEPTDASKISRVIPTESARKILDRFDHFEPADTAAGKDLKEAVATFRHRTYLN